MDTDADSKIIETTNDKHTVKIRTYTTGGDEEAVLSATASGMTTTVEGDGPDAEVKTVVDNTVTHKVNRILVERFVQEVDGSKERIIERVYEFRSPAFKELIKALQKVTELITPDGQKKSNS